MSGSHCTLPAIAIGTADGSPPVPVEGPVQIRCTAEECRVHLACAGSERSQPGRGKVCGRARRRALCARCSHLVWQVSPRAARHARTHEYIMHHNAWTACSPHVLAGRRKAVELTGNGYLWLYKSWAVAYGAGACCCAMACIGLPHVWTESDRQIDLSQRVCSTRCKRSILSSLQSLTAGFRERSWASETDSICTVADAVATGRSAAGL